MTPRILIIAGSDSGGGAGVQADIKTVTMLGGHAMTAITAVTAQNTLGVQGVHPVPTEIVLAQIDSCLSDIGADAIKIGMIGSAETANAVAERLPDGIPVVLDPVMVATSGGVLADPATVVAMDALIARATLVTPNLPELEALGGEDRLLGLEATLLVKGGHGDGAEITDRLIHAQGEIACWTAPRIDTTSTHGTGCTLASAIAVALAEGMTLPDAVARARTFVRLALHDAPGLGGGHGPMGQQNVRLDLGRGDAVPNHVTLPLTDYDRSADFYRLLGLRIMVDVPPRYARFESADGPTLSIEAADEMPGGKALFFFECRDLDAMVARVRAAGHDVTGPRDEPWDWREARLTDPSGNALCLYQAGEMRRYPPWRV